jgi:glutamyl-tRNA reductase
MSEILLLGISHKTAPVAVRERLALTQAQAPEFLKDLVSTPAIREAVVISTCNRTELLLVVGDAVEAETTALGALATQAGIRPTELAESIYSPKNCDAARQLFRVCAGLDSMIVGEAEVQGQVRKAFEVALAAGTAGPLSSRLFNAALKTGKRARSETAIGAGGASVSSVAVDLAQDALGDLGSRHVVIIGAGETAELTAQALAAKGVTTVFIANRRADRARSLAARFGGGVLPLDRLPEQLQDADMVVAATASPHPIIGEEELKVVMDARGHRPLLVLDIAVPRDVEHGCGDIEGVTLIDVDGLQRTVARNRAGREGESVRAEQIVEEELQRFATWLGQLDVVPTIAALREHGSEIVEQVIAENAGRWEGASPRDLARVEAMARSIMNRLLHEPTIRLKALGDGRGHGRLETIRELFGLEEGAADAVGQDEAAGNVRQLRRP